MKNIMYKYGTDIQFEIARLNKDNFKYIKNFSCGNSSIDEYLKERAMNDAFGTTYIVIDNTTLSVVGYCTMCCSGLTHKYQNNIHTIPAIEIKYFAIDASYQNLRYDDWDEHYYFSDYIFQCFMNMCSDISETTLAAKCIILYSVKEAVAFYRRLGFDNFSKFYEPDIYRYIEDCTPMYIEIML